MTQRAVDRKKNTITLSISNEDERPFELRFNYDKTTNQWSLNELKQCDLFKFFQYLTLVDHFTSGWIATRRSFNE